MLMASFPAARGLAAHRTALRRPRRTPRTIVVQMLTIGSLEPKRQTKRHQCRTLEKRHVHRNQPLINLPRIEGLTKPPVGGRGWMDNTERPLEQKLN